MADLLSEDELYEISIPVRRNRLCGIYFLFRDDELVYVGQSIALLSRLNEHIRSNKLFNRVAFQHFLACELDEIEAEYILAYRPEYNRKIPPLVYEAVFLEEDQVVSATQ